MFGEAAPQIALDARAAQLISALSTQQSFVCTDHLQARRRYRASRQQLAWPCEMVGEAVDLLIEEPGVPRLRLFRPLESRPRQSLQTLIYLHGGGWTVGDLSVYEPLCRKLANLLPANIIWVEYRLAPEHPFPAPLEDTLTAISWIFRHARKLAIDDTRIGLAGDSAGANLAAVAALVNRGESLRELAQGYLLTRSTYRWYLDNYLDGADPLHWRLSPLRSTTFRDCCRLSSFTPVTIRCMTKQSTMPVS